MDSVGHSLRRKKTSLSGDLAREGPAKEGWSKEGPDQSFTLLGLHASHCTGTCVVHAGRHVPCLFTVGIPDQRRPEEGPDSTSFTLLGLHASRCTGICVVHAARHVPYLSAVLIRQGLARPEEGLDSISFTPQEHVWCRLLDTCHVCLLSESLISEGPARPEEGPGDRTTHPSLCWASMHPVTQEYA